MPRPRNPIPTYRLHKQSGQAIVTINVSGVRKDVLLGAYNSPRERRGPGASGVSGCTRAASVRQYERGLASKNWT